MSGIGFGLKGARRGVSASSGGSGGPTYTAEAASYFAAMTVQPDAARKGLLDTLIAGLKADGLWTRLDWLAICASHDEQAGRINAINPAQVASAPVAPSFTADRGFTGNGTTQYLDTGWNPLTASSPKFTQNSSHMGVWIGTDLDSSTKYELGQTNRASICGRTVSSMRVLASGSSAITAAISPSTAIGHSAWSRRSSSDTELYKNGASVATSVFASVALLNVNFLICATNGTGPVASQFSNRRVQAAHWGSGLSDADVAKLQSRLAAYMTAVGA